MQKIILIFCLILLTCGSVAANPRVIQGVGQVELERDIVMTGDHDAKGDLNYSFRVKDGAVWRAALMMPVNNMPSNELGNIIKLDVLLDEIVSGELGKSNDVLSIEKSRLIMLGKKECATITVKLALPNAGFVANMDMIMIPGVDGLKMFTFMCSDSDAQYWRPIMQKISATIP